MSLRKVVLVVFTILSALYGVESAGPVQPLAYNGTIVEARYDCVANKEDTAKVDIWISISPNAPVNTYAISDINFDYNLRNGTAGDEKLCRKGLTTIQSSSNITLIKCNATTPLYLHFLKKTLNQPIIFGKNYHVLKLDCRGGASKLYSLKQDLLSANNTNKITNEIPEIELGMKIGVKTGATEIHVGDNLQVTVTDSSSPPQFLAFVDCFADNTANKRIDLITKGASVETDVIAAVNNWQTPGSQSMDMTAFRFEGTISEVRIQCTIMACNDDKCKVTNRRRRSSNDGITDLVEATYTVSDKKVASGQDKAFANFVMMSILLLVPKLW